MSAGQPLLFGSSRPEGMSYRADFISPAQEESLLAGIRTMTFEAFELRGVVAKRRVAFFGQSYGRDSAGTIPMFLQPLRCALAAWANVESDAFAMALVNEYQPGAPIGWHRDAPQYDLVAGVSLLSACRMTFRPYLKPADVSGSRAPRRATHELVLQPRSAYLLTGESRTDFEHHIPSVSALRYSITFRTLRTPARR